MPYVCTHLFNGLYSLVVMLITVPSFRYRALAILPNIHWTHRMMNVVQEQFRFSVSVMCCGLERIISMIRRRPSFSKWSFLAFRIFLRASQYTHSGSVIMCVSTHSHCAYSSRLSFNLHQHMSRYLLRFEGHCADERIAILRNKAGGVVQQWRIDNALIGVGPEFPLFFTSSNTWQSDTMSAAFYQTFSIMKLLKRCTQHERWVVEPFTCDNLRIESIWNKIKGVT